MIETKHIRVINNPGPRGFIKFLSQVEQAIKDGWEIDTEAKGFKNGPRMNGVFRVQVKRGVADDPFEVLEKDRASKQELLALAKELDIEIPKEKAKFPASIKKYIKDSLAKGSKEDKKAEEPIEKVSEESPAVETPASTEEDIDKTENTSE